MSILLRTRHHAEAQHHARIMADLALEADDGTPIRITSTRPAGDERTLRGIPAIGRNVGGAIPGTRPDTAVRPTHQAP